MNGAAGWRKNSPVSARASRRPRKTNPWRWKSALPRSSSSHNCRATRHRTESAIVAKLPAGRGPTTASSRCRAWRCAIWPVGASFLGWSSRVGKAGRAEKETRSMNVTDPIGDMLSRIRNAQERGKSKVTSPASRLRTRVLDVLQQEGFIRGYATVEYSSGKSEIEIELKYFDGEPVIREIHRVSKPGRRVYASVKNLPRVNNGLGISVLSTPKGIMADHEARDANVGGEILFTVF